MYQIIIMPKEAVLLLILVDFLSKKNVELCK